MKTGPSRGPVGMDQATRHNPRAGAAFQAGGCAKLKTQDLMSLNDVASRASMSTGFIRKHLREIPHHRASARGKIWIEWIDFLSWFRGLHADITRDDCVGGILEEAGRKRSGSI